MYLYGIAFKNDRGLQIIAENAREAAQLARTAYKIIERVRPPAVESVVRLRKEPGHAVKGKCPYCLGGGKVGA
jgi:hypothetical protein